MSHCANNLCSICAICLQQTCCDDWFVDEMTMEGMGMTMECEYEMGTQRDGSDSVGGAVAGYEGMVTDKGDEVVMTHCDDLSVAVGDGDSVSVDRGDNKPPGNFNALA